MRWAYHLHQLGSFFIYSKNLNMGDVYCSETFGCPETKWHYNPEDNSFLEPQLTEWDCGFPIQGSTSQLRLFLHASVSDKRNNFTATTRH
jgi:hypothetical protein